MKNWIKKWQRRLWPVDGNGTSSWGYSCLNVLKGRPCVEARDHGYAHVSAEGFRWADKPVATR